MLYPGNYGYIPNTLSGDGDPLDILLICDYGIYPGVIVNVKVIGVLETCDEKGDDEKLIAVPSYHVDKNYNNINSLDTLGDFYKNKIKHFFEHYKDNEDSKWVTVKEFGGTDRALDIYNESKKRASMN